MADEKNETLEFESLALFRHEAERLHALENLRIEVKSLNALRKFYNSNNSFRVYHGVTKTTQSKQFDPMLFERALKQTNGNKTLAERLTGFSRWNCRRYLEAKKLQECNLTC